MTKILKVALYGLLASLSAVAQADLLGSEMSLQVLVQDTPTSERNPTAALTTAAVSATEVEFAQIGFLDFEDPVLRVVNVDIDVGADFVTINFDGAGGGAFANAFFNGYVLSFEAEPALEFTSATVNVDLTTLGLVDDNLSFEDNQLSVNVAGLGFNGTTFARIDLGVTEVPLPAAAWMLLGALAVLRWRTRR